MIPRSVAAMSLVVSLLAQNPASAQVTSAPSAPSSGVQRLRVIVLEGEGAINHIPTRTAVAPVVEVRDENDQPVQGASVVFQLPAAGPGGTFKGGLKTQTAVSDSRGQAGARNLLSNDQPGRFNIKVTATLRDLSAGVVISQTNSTKLQTTIAPPSRSKKWIWILVAAGAGGGAGIYFTQFRNNSSPVSAFAGPAVIGAPR